MEWGSGSRQLQQGRTKRKYPRAFQGAGEWQLSCPVSQRPTSRMAAVRSPRKARKNKREGGHATTSGRRRESLSSPQPLQAICLLSLLWRINATTVSSGTACRVAVTVSFTVLASLPRGRCRQANSTTNYDKTTCTVAIMHEIEVDGMDDDMIVRQS